MGQAAVVDADCELLVSYSRVYLLRPSGQVDAILWCEVSKSAASTVGSPAATASRAASDPGSDAYGSAESSEENESNPQKDNIASEQTIETTLPAEGTEEESSKASEQNVAEQSEPPLEAESF